MNSIRHLGLLMGFWLATAATAGHAFSITAVDVFPDPPITESDPVSLVVGITTPSQDAFLFAPTEVERIGNAFTIDIYISDGMILPATDFLEETVALGALATGSYSYLVRITPGYDVNFGKRELSGDFSVVPLPAPVILIGSALAVFAALRGTDRSA